MQFAQPCGRPQGGLISPFLIGPTQIALAGGILWLTFVNDD
jgi:hypothetical protein